jgi:deoxyadenosine/deoxycytidine kinase
MAETKPAHHFSWPTARIEICGPLGAGKTTLMSLLAYYGCQAVYEPVEQHPYLAAFYTDPARFALEKCGFFALDYLHSVKSNTGATRSVVMDTGVPVLRAYHDVAPLGGIDRMVADRLLDGVAAAIAPADLYIHLTASTEQLLERIAKRGRTIEASVPASYVAELNARLDQHLQNIDSRSRLLSLELSALEGLTEPETIYPVITRINIALHHALDDQRRGARQEPALPLSGAAA